MKIYKNVDLFQLNNPIEIADDIKMYAESTVFDRGFLCGLIKTFEPEKILEIGVAAGITSSIILNCIQTLDLNTKVVSVDYSKEFYRDPNKLTGFVTEKFKLLSGCDCIHECYYGNVVAEYIEEISKYGKEPIDFLILDTTHMLPGELLDFIVTLPFLSDNAIVVVHDISLNHVQIKEPLAIATKILFDVVSAEKYYVLDHLDKEHPLSTPNIAAFQITADTKNNIIDVFSALELIWRYIPDNSDLAKYSEIVHKYYDEHLIEQYDRIISLQTCTTTIMDNEIKLHYKGDLKSLNRRWSSLENVYIYGGVLGEEIL